MPRRWLLRTGSRLALFGIVPYFDKSLKMNTPSGRIERSASGIGDLLFLGR
jgi:hypothetical protein